MKGRDKEFKCIICGRYVAYKDIGTKVTVVFTYDTEFTVEKTEMYHKKCIPNEIENMLKTWKKNVEKLEISHNQKQDN